MTYIPFLAVLAMIVATVGLGFYATSKSRSASDFFVAGRSVSVFWNASAISGEYLSAASFMGIAGMLMKNGYDVLWYPACYAAGYLFLLLFIAGPLRRFGAYTIPDFAEGRFDSPAFRKAAVIFVLFIGFFYTMPQMKGAGVTMVSILGWPYWAGIVVVGAVITFNVALGGMKGITFVQAFQYWAKVFAISVPFFVLATIHGGYPSKVGENVANPKAYPTFHQDATLAFKGQKEAPSNAIAMPVGGRTAFSAVEALKLSKLGTTRKLAIGEAVASNGLDEISIGRPGRTGADAALDYPAGSTFAAVPIPITKNGALLLKDGKPVTTSAKLEISEPTKLRFVAGGPVPNSPTNKKWVEPFGTFTSKYENPLLYTYSLIIALVCGTAGLPHILVRFYTNPDGRSAKRTTLWVMIMIGTFYIFPPMWGAMGRSVMPQLYANNLTDSVVLKLPGTLANSLLGQILSGITAAGAFAAFMSTFSGLLVSMSGALAHDIYGKILRPNATQEQRLKAFKVAAFLFGTVSVILGCFVENFDINKMVGWAFAIAAASYFPLLLLGAWWRKLTLQGAASGMLIGGTASLLAIISSMLIEKGIIAYKPPMLVGALMDQPAIWGVPLSLGLMIVVSLMTQKNIPADINLKMLRLHAPEELGLSKNFIEH